MLFFMEAYDLGCFWYGLEFRALYSHSYGALGMLL
jgi:hypothetical protein